MRSMEVLMRFFLALFMFLLCPPYVWAVTRDYMPSNDETVCSTYTQRSDRSREAYISSPRMADVDEILAFREELLQPIKLLNILAEISNDGRLIVEGMNGRKINLEPLRDFLENKYKPEVDKLFAEEQQAQKVNEMLLNEWMRALQALLNAGCADR